MKAVNVAYFSPTHGSEKTVRAIAKGLCSTIDVVCKEINLTFVHERAGEYSFEKDEVLIFGFPVYGGRIPQLLCEMLAKFTGDHTPAIIVATYGNRAYEDALLEAKDILKSRGFDVIAAGAFIAEHSLSAKLAAGRPDAHDLKAAEDFGKQIAQKLIIKDVSEVEVPGNYPYKERGSNKVVLPVTDDKCTYCGECILVCPVSAIDKADPKSISDDCLNCSACIKTCKFEAKRFSDERLLHVIAMLEEKCAHYKEYEVFLSS